MNVKIEELEDERQISTNLLNVVEEDKWLPYTPFLLSPLAWNAAYEIDNANNGYSLTNGNFLSQSDIKFETGMGSRLSYNKENAV